MNEFHAPLTWQDVRFTTRGNVLYAICLGIPRGEVKIASLAGRGNAIKSIELLGSQEKVAWKATGDSLAIQPARNWPCEHAVVFKLRNEERWK